MQPDERPKVTVWTVARWIARAVIALFAVMALGLAASSLNRGHRAASVLAALIMITVVAGCWWLVERLVSRR